ncbi:inositol monophosphatase, partial [Clavulina sp. PMI_390]
MSSSNSPTSLDFGSPAARTTSLLQIHTHAITLARQAGSYLRRENNRWRRLAKQRESVKKAENAVDLVTESDVEVERMIREGVKERWPEHAFIGEESYSAGEEKRFLLTDAPTWIVDPIDGSVNTIHHFPMTAISIAFCLDSTPVVGVVFAPFLGLHGTLYSAVLGVGAWMAEASYPADAYPPPAGSDNTLDSTGEAEYVPIDLPIISPPPPLPQNAPNGCLFLSEWGKDRRPGEDGNLAKKRESFYRMAVAASESYPAGGKVHGIRSLGSSTMDMVYVAAGQADIMYEAGCWEWDIAAAVCILLQTGGIVVDSNPPAGFQQGDGRQIPRASLGGRRFLAIRGCSDEPSDGNGQAPLSSREQQERLVWAVWSATARLNYTRPGL